MWESVNDVISLIIPFIVLATISLATEKLTSLFEILMSKVPRLPNYFEWYIAYILVVIIGYIFCWQGNWSLFQYLDVHFNYDWQGYLVTSLLLSSGSTGVKKVFGMIENIPSNISGVKGTKIKSVEAIQEENNNFSYEEDIVKKEEDRYSSNI